MTGPRGMIGIPIDVDPLYAGDLVDSCRVCGCTDGRACWPTCSWVEDPLGLGHLCSRCLAIAVAVTDRDLFDPPSPLLGMAIMAIAGFLTGAVAVHLAHVVGLL